VLGWVTVHSFQIQGQTHKKQFVTLAVCGSGVTNS
jgi:hypothetical protein